MRLLLTAMLCVFSFSALADERYANIDAHARKEMRHHSVRHLAVHKSRPRVTYVQRRGVAPHELAYRAAKQVADTVSAAARVVSDLVHAVNAPIDRLPPPLVGKLAEIQGACEGFRVISTRCGHGGHSWNIRGTHRRSLHCVDKAADFVVGDYGCAYAHLHDWRGGLSGDPGAVGHVHLSFGGHEGKFCHGGHGGTHCMFARHESGRKRHAGRHRRYARA